MLVGFSKIKIKMYLMASGVSDHDMLCLKGEEQRPIRRPIFKFLNNVASMKDFD